MVAYVVGALGAALVRENTTLTAIADHETDQGLAAITVMSTTAQPLAGAFQSAPLARYCVRN